VDDLEAAPQVKTPRDSTARARRATPARRVVPRVAALLLAASPWPSLAQRCVVRDPLPCDEGLPAGASAPRDSDAVKRCVLEALVSHREADAARMARAMVDTWPTDDEARAILAKAQLRDGEYDGGLVTHLSLPPGRRSDFGLDAIVEAAMEVVRAQQEIVAAEAGGGRSHFENAAKTIRAVVDRDADNLATRLLLSWLYLEKLHRPASADTQARAVLRVAPDEPRAQRLLATAAAHAGAFDEAIAWYRCVLGQKPGDHDARALLARTLLWAHRTADARRLLDQGPPADSQHTALTIVTAEMMAAEGHLPAAIRALEPLVQSDPSNVGALVALGDLYRWSWRLADARRAYRDALHLDDQAEPARQGLAALWEMTARQFAPEWARLEDNFGLATSSFGAAARMPLWAGGFLSARATRSQFDQEGLTTARFDFVDALEQHVGAALEVRTSVAARAPVGYDAGVGIATAATWSRARALRLSGSVAYGQPVRETMAATLMGLTYDGGGIGVDASLTGRLSAQGEASVARYADENRRAFVSAQLSIALPAEAEAFVRLRYERLAFRRRSDSYFAPAVFTLVRPSLAATDSLSHGVSLYAAAEAPFVVDRRRLGAGASLGLVARGRRGAEIGASLFVQNIPTALEWTGRGGRVHGSVNF
jgi:tetratricopeptide (TPR) repeat protein